jgi:hypothetical protein
VSVFPVKFSTGMIYVLLLAVGWSSKSPTIQGFGENPSAKSQILNLIHSIRTVARSKKMFFVFLLLICRFCFSSVDISQHTDNNN